MTAMTTTLSSTTNGAATLAVGLDAPVSNMPDEVAVPSAAVEAPNPGRAAGVAHIAAGDGSEGLIELASAESVRVLTVPDLRFPDIAEASFGGSLIETVHGPDDRVRITSPAQHPWRMNCSLLITARDNSQWIGTGWFIGPHTIMTAGHVVYIYAPGTPRHGWARSIQVMPGRDVSSLPYGSATSGNFRSVTGWTNSGSEHNDYGAIILPTELGNTTGWYGFGNYSDADLLATVANISGYPGDKPSGTQWYAARKVASVNATKVYYDIDSAGGQSGSAVYRTVNGQRYAVAVHAYGGPTTNSGTRINAAVYQNMVAWKA